VQNAQSVGALLPHHPAQSYGSGLAQEKKLCVRGSEPNAAMIHRRQHGAGSGEGAADESAAGADATAVAEHALVLVPGDRSQCLPSGDLLRVLRRLKVKIPHLAKF